LVAFLRELLLGDAPILSESFERVVALHRRSHWLATRLPVNKYIPAFPIGLYFLAERHLPPHIFQSTRLPSYLQNWAKFIRHVDDAHASDGRRYDLKLHPDTLAIIGREPDDD
jgi:hypothetical protein